MCRRESKRRERKEGKRFSALRRQTLAGIALLCALSAGCASARETAEGTPTPGRPDTAAGSTPDSAAGLISTVEALELIAALEQEPFSPVATAQRNVLTAWLVASPDVGPLTVDDRAIKPLQESDYPYSPELFLQYMFGMARAQALKTGAPQPEVIESGLRSLLAAYKSIIAAEADMRNPFLDTLDRLRQQGKLAEYVRSLAE